MVGELESSQENGGRLGLAPKGWLGEDAVGLEVSPDQAVVYNGSQSFAYKTHEDAQ